MAVLPLDEAPFWKYLEILRENGHKDDADISEQLYVELLTTIKNPDGEFYSKEQVMGFKFKNVHAASELILKNAEKEIETTPPVNTGIGGRVMFGAGADELSPETLQQLATRQSLYHEENKIKQVVR